MFHVGGFKVGHTHAGEHVGEFDVISNYSRTSGLTRSGAFWFDVC